MFRLGLPRLGLRTDMPAHAGEAPEPPWDPVSLFANGEQGWWFDWQDSAVRFQDASGTLPAGTAAQQIGLHLDKSKGLVLGSALTHLTRQTSGAVTDNGNGTWTLGANAWLRFNFDQSQLVQGGLYLVEFSGLDVTGTVTIDMCDLAAPVITGPRSGPYSFMGQRSVYDSTFRFVDVLVGGSSSATVSAPTLKLIAGNHRFQAGVSSLKGTLRQSAGGVWYVQADGNDDCLYTNPIDFTACNEITMCVALRKMSDSAFGMAAELSAAFASNPGSFYVAAPLNNSGTSFRAACKGTTDRVLDVTGYGAPVSAVITLTADISAPLLSCRINGTPVTPNTSSQGSGNFGNYPMYFWRRNNASNPFNGYEIASLCIGRALSAGEISDLESNFSALLAGV